MDSQKGNSQSSTSLWERILDHYHEAMGRGVYRNNDGINGKWRKLRIECTKFNGIYNNLVNMRRSGENEFGIFTTAMEQYGRVVGKPFKHMRSWELMRTGPKWLLTPDSPHSSTGSKRGRTPDDDISDARDPIDLDDDTEPQTEMPPPRPPIGRDRAKRASRDASGLSSKDDVEEKVDRLVEQFHRHNDLAESRLDYVLFSRSGTEEDLEAIRLMTEQRRKKYFNK